MLSTVCRTRVKLLEGMIPCIGVVEQGVQLSGFIPDVQLHTPSSDVMKTLQ